MKIFTLNKTTSVKNGGTPFWMPWGFWRWVLKSISFALLLILFILLFTLPRCGTPQRQIVIGPDTTIVNPDGNPVVGKHPELFNPENPRPQNPGGNRNNGRGGEPVDWPEQIEDGNRRNPALPPKDRNRVPPTDPGQVIPDPRTGKQVDANHLLVVLDSDQGDETFNRFAEELSSLYDESFCSISYYNTLTKLLVLTVEADLREEIKENLPRQISDIDFYVCDIEVLAPEAVHPTDPAFSYPSLCWHFEPIQAYEAWEITTGSRDVKVAVVDSYFQLDHYEFSGVKIISPVSIENGTTDVSPRADADPGSFVHGTHVAGLIFGQMNNAEGGCGIAPGCSFIPVSLGAGMNTASLVEGILYAIYQGADVVNASIGLSIPQEIANRMSLPLQAEIARTQDIAKEFLWDYIYKLSDERNVTIVWAAGNSNILSAIDNSKRGESTVKVDAVNQNLRKADFSNFGNLPAYGFRNSTVSAPGCSVLSSIPYYDYYPLDGTSMAAPIVSGAVALMKSVCPSLTNREIIETLQNTSLQLKDRSIGGLLQIRDALDRIMEDFMRFEDVMHDHSKIIGQWQSTELLLTTQNGQETGEKATITLIFPDEDSGRIEIEYKVGERTGEICCADISVEYSDENIVIRESDYPTSPQGSRFMMAVLTCIPDEQGLLKVFYKHEDDTITEFYLRKIE